MGKMNITAYTDESFSKVHKTALELPVSPAKLKFSKSVRYAEDRQLGTLNGSNTYVRYRPETLYFECLLDCTNAVEENVNQEKSVYDMVNELEQRLYVYNPDGHRPSFVKVQYGNILFMGQLQNLETEYTLFNEDGIPLRAELKVTLTGYRSQKEEKKSISQCSPDVSRLVTLKEGQTLAALCATIYGDPLLVAEVALFNNLDGYRDVPAGTEVLLPMLKKE